MMLWKNKILIRAEPPSSSFRCLHLILLQHPSPPLKLHSLCWKLSRKWHLACFFDSSDVYIAYQHLICYLPQKSQYDSAVHVVKELSECLPVSDVVVDEELTSGSLIAKAVDCCLRSVLLENGWRCIGNGCMVNSCFGSSEEKNDLYAIQLAVQADTDDGFVFVVSPDVVRFNRLKGACRLGIGSDLPVWTKAGYCSDNHILTVNEGAGIPTTEDGMRSFFKGLLSSQDFRTPKPIPEPSLQFVSVNESSEDIFMLSNTGSLRKDIQSDVHVQFQDAVSINTVTKFIPLFKGHTHSKKISLSGPSLKGNATTEKHGLLKEIEMDLLDRGIDMHFVGMHFTEDIGKQLKEMVGIAATKDTEKSTWKKQKTQHPEPPNNTTVEGLERAILKKRAKQLSGSSATGGDRDEKLKKKQMKQQVNPSNIVAKVMDCHAKGQLVSLTVPELKSFLTVKKAKVGGKKEDLIQRIVSILA
ncbi:hypothetical protein ACLOJK_007411 [Asimina triloba]